jgi:hypothetical protein
MRKNCWEVMLCGREAGGHADASGVCPAAISGEFDGVNGGKFRGRCCWFVAGTCCHGEVQGQFAKKLMDCINCHFLKQVHEEEGHAFVLTPMSLKEKGRLFR